MAWLRPVFQPEPELVPDLLIRHCQLNAFLQSLHAHVDGHLTRLAHTCPICPKQFGYMAISQSQGWRSAAVLLSHRLTMEAMKWSGGRGLVAETELRCSAEKCVVVSTDDMARSGK